MTLVGARDLLLDDFDLLRRRVGLAVAQRALQRERGVVDDGQRIFDLVRELGGEPAGGTQLAFARGEFARFLGGELLAFQQHLRAVTAARHQQQHRQPQHKRFAPVIWRRQVERAHASCVQLLHHKNVQHATST